MSVTLFLGICAKRTGPDSARRNMAQQVQYLDLLFSDRDTGLQYLNEV